MSKLSTTAKRIVSAGVALTISMGLLACGGGGDQGSSSDTVSIMLPLYQPQPPAANNPVLKKLEQITGKKLDFQWAPNSSYSDKTNITLAGDNVPDLMVFKEKDPGFVKNAQAGAFWDLTGKLDKYPNLKPADKEALAATSVNGTVYGVYRRRAPMRVGVMIRKDWLDKLGLSMPKTTDDLNRIAKAFTEDDPDGDGKKDTTGLIIPQWPGSIGTSSPMDVMETWFGAGNTWTVRNGKLIPSFETPQFLQADTFLRTMKQHGYINADFATLNSDDWNDQFFQGKGGIIIDVLDRSDDLAQLFKEQHPKDFGKYVAVTGNLSGPDGKVYSYPTGGAQGVVAIPKAQVRSEDQLDKMLSILNKLNSREAEVVMSNGLEGVNFNVQDGYAVPVAKQTKQVQTINTATQSYVQLLMNVNGPDVYQTKPDTATEQKLAQQVTKIEAADLKHAVYNLGAPYVSKTYVSKGAQLDNIIADARVKYIGGQIDEQGYRNAIALWRKSGGDQVTAEMNDLYQKNK